MNYLQRIKRVGHKIIKKFIMNQKTKEDTEINRKTKNDNALRIAMVTKHDRGDDRSCPNKVALGIPGNPIGPRVISIQLLKIEKRII